MPDLLDEEVTVYVIDDNQDMREGIEWMLTSVGYRVKSFSDAESCLRLIEPRTAYCMVVDSLMPRMTGLRFCRQAFAINGGVSVIMISAHGDVTTTVERLPSMTQPLLAPDTAFSFVARADDVGCQTEDSE